MHRLSILSQQQIVSFILQDGKGSNKNADEKKTVSGHTKKITVNALILM
jgi:hypothetical protein